MFLLKWGGGGEEGEGGKGRGQGGNGEGGKGEGRMGGAGGGSASRIMSVFILGHCATTLLLKCSNPSLFKSDSTLLEKQKLLKSLDLA